MRTGECISAVRALGCGPKVQVADSPHTLSPESVVPQWLLRGILMQELASV